jgi:hypothetical protein
MPEVARLILSITHDGHVLKLTTTHRGRISKGVSNDEPSLGGVLLAGCSRRPHSSDATPRTPDGHPIWAACVPQDPTCSARAACRQVDHLQQQRAPTPTPSRPRLPTTRARLALPELVAKVKELNDNQVNEIRAHLCASWRPRLAPAPHHPDREVGTFMRPNGSFFRYIPIDGRQHAPTSKLRPTAIPSADGGRHAGHDINNSVKTRGY